MPTIKLCVKVHTNKYYSVASGHDSSQIFFMYYGYYCEELFTIMQNNMSSAKL